MVAAVAAGCDQVLMCHRPDRQDRAIEALVEAVIDGRLPITRLEDAAARVAVLARAYDPARQRFLPEEVLRSAESLHFAESLFQG